MNNTTTPTKTESSVRIPPNPSGLCMCGCGQTTKIAECNSARGGWVKGEHLRYVQYHTSKTKFQVQCTPPNPSGLCQCGCGQTTKVATYTHSKNGWVKGEHLRYIHGHNGASTLTTEERFWNSVDKSGDCWLWTSIKNKAGYGVLCTKNKHILAHRYSYELANGPIPEGMLICHHCDTPACVRDSHLFCGTDADNVADKVAKGRIPKGENHHNAKLTDDDVRQLRIDYANGVSTTTLSKKHGIHERTARKLAKGQRRKYAE